VHTGESTAEIETEAGSNDITESAYPLHDNRVTGMLGFYDDIFSTFICLMFDVWRSYLLISLSDFWQ